MDESFERTVLARLPLAQSVLTLMRWALDGALLQTTYELTRGRCHQRLLTFPAFVQLLFDCLSQPWASARAGLVKAQDRGEHPVSLKAFYDKLKNTPVAVSLGFFRVVAERLRAVLPDTRPRCPPSLRSLTPLLMDGKVVKHMCRRLKPLRRDRSTACKLRGPRTLVLANRWTGLLHDLVAGLDGEANEVPYVVPLLQRAQATVGGAWLLVGDRAFGLFQVAQDILDHGGQFLLRKHGVTPFLPDRDRPAQRSTDRWGRFVVQEWGWIVRGKATKAQPRLAVRQITVQRTTASLVLLSSLQDEAMYPVEDLLDTYLARWDIERMFQQITDVFHLRNLFSTSPQGLLFQLVLAFLTYNVVQVVKQLIAQEQKSAAQALSTEMLFRDIQEELVAMHRLLDTAAVIEQPPRCATAQEVRSQLEGLLKLRWCNRWKKADCHPRNSAKLVAA